MKIYKAEAKAGLADKLQNNTVAYCHEVVPYTPTAQDIVKTKAIAENQNQVDLYYIKSILVSTGWNKNDDVFDPAETWRARTSPEDKQFNYMHDEKDIIGHITSCYASDHAGNVLPDINEMSQVPSEFDIVTGSVLYTSWSDKTLQSRMHDIIQEIEAGDMWHVSMECLFPNFDYAMIDPQGSTKVVKREEASAFLTKHLRAYGGSGEYNGFKLGRLLRNFSFSGVGLVRKPANPRSVILKTDKAITFSETMAQEYNMSEELETLQAELAEAKQSNDKMKEDAEKAKCDFDLAVSALQAELVEAKEALAAEKKDKEKMADEMNKMKKEKMMEKRKAALSDAGLDSAELDETSAKFESLSDEVFETVVAALKKANTATAKQNPVEEKEDEPAGPNGDKVKGKKPAKADIEVDANEADADVLEAAEADNDIAMADVQDPIEDVKTYAANWFGNILKSTASIK